MATLIDSSLWIDFIRPRTPRRIKQFITPFILDPEAHLAEPITFEILRHATPVEDRQIRQQFQTLPTLVTPLPLWNEAAVLGQACRRGSLTIKALDLLIAAVALHHDAELITFDDDFEKIASVSRLKVKLLKRPTP